jgi:hypothetical protein
MLFFIVNRFVQMIHQLNQYVNAFFLNITLESHVQIERLDILE